MCVCGLVCNMLTLLLLMLMASHRSLAQDMKQAYRKPCGFDSDCVDNAYCVGQIYCLCKPGFVINSEDGQLACLQEPCGFDSDCVDNAYCVGQIYCLCKPGFVINSEDGQLACLQEATHIGDACTADIQCSKTFGAQAQCLNNGTCGCREDAHFMEDLCYRSVPLGGLCRVRNDCRNGPSTFQATCIRGECVCTFGFHSSADGWKCIQNILLDGPCSLDSDCFLTNNSRCMGGLCGCQVNFISSADNRRCLRWGLGPNPLYDWVPTLLLLKRIYDVVAERLGEKCEEDAQCSEFIQHSTCGNTGRCECPEYYHSVSPDGWCWESLGLGESCTNSRQCVVRGNVTDVTTCSNEVCECVQGYTPNNEKTDCRIKEQFPKFSRLYHLCPNNRVQNGRRSERDPTTYDMSKRDLILSVQLNKKTPTEQGGMPNALEPPREPPSGPDSILSTSNAETKSPTRTSTKSDCEARSNFEDEFVAVTEGLNSSNRNISDYNSIPLLSPINELGS
uniref:EGF-like domain-containing protein n=1 Tax=Timema cristinae TaxID=61476 RepID=A0A7R9CP02_TIMCR|nr:unnamed protein product [Timema cristinae]